MLHPALLVLSVPSAPSAHLVPLGHLVRLGLDCLRVLLVPLDLYHLSHP